MKKVVFAFALVLAGGLVSNVYANNGGKDKNKKKTEQKSETKTETSTSGKSCSSAGTTKTCCSATKK